MSTPSLVLAQILAIAIPHMKPLRPGRLAMSDERFGGRAVASAG